MATSAIDIDQFLNMPAGIAFASRVFNEWRHSVDGGFLEWFISNHCVLDEYRFRHAVVLLQDIDSETLRSVMTQYIGHAAAGYAVGAAAFFAVQLKRGYISSAPVRER